MGFLYTSHYYLSVSGGVCVFMILAICLSIGVFLNSKSWWKRIVSLIAPVSLLLLNLLNRLFLVDLWTRGLNPLGAFWYNNTIAVIGGEREIYILLQSLYYVIVWVCVFLCILWTKRTFVRAIPEYIILCAGLLSSMILGFSPTIYVSGDRASLYASVALLIVAVRTILNYRRNP